MAVDKESWHLDKRVPISLIVTLLMQSVVLIWWASSLDARVSQLEKTTTAQANAQSISSAQMALLSTELTKLTATLQYSLQTQQEMKLDLRALLDEARKAK